MFALVTLGKSAPDKEQRRHPTGVNFKETSSKYPDSRLDQSS